MSAYEIIWGLGQLLGTALLTFVLEYPVMRISFGKKHHLFLNTFLINFITNLILNLGVVLLQIEAMGIILVLELCVVASESMLFGYCYREISKRRVIMTCLLSNLFSFGIGLLLSFMKQI